MQDMWIACSLESVSDMLKAIGTQRHVTILWYCNDENLFRILSFTNNNDIIYTKSTLRIINDRLK